MLRVDATAVYVVGMKLLLSASSYCCCSRKVMLLLMTVASGVADRDCCGALSPILPSSDSEETLQGRKRHQPETKWPHLWTITFVTTFLHLLQLFIAHTCNSKYLAAIYYVLRS
ncbi:hypothetical protein NC651_006582 [Populus alba x Populus x berolinensis]|nr:hypothetical protein NC651_006582 [Populus alba x Populus x berolinensis]